MMTGCGSLKRSTDTAKTRVLDRRVQDMAAFVFVQCPTKKKNYFIHGCNTRTTISIRKEKRILITGHN